MIFFDTHIHLEDIKDITPKALEAFGVMRCICVSAKESDWEKVAKLSKAMPKIIVPAFAIHPWYISDIEANWADYLEKMLQENPKALVGECGFDRLKNQDFEAQAKVFDIQLYLAQKYNRPLLIHAVKAWNWLENYWDIMPQKFVFHSFNAHMEQLKKILDYGGYIAVNKSILKNKSADKILSAVPWDRLLLESDAPYQSDISDLEPLCLAIAKIRDVDVHELSEQLFNNAREFIKND